MLRHTLTAALFVMAALQANAGDSEVVRSIEESSKNTVVDGGFQLNHEVSINDSKSVPVPRPRPNTTRLDNVVVDGPTPSGGRVGKDKYGAVAAGIDLKNGVAHGVVTRDFATKEEASLVALTECRQAIKNCKIQGTFTKCAYVTTGTNPKTKKVGWAVGPEPNKTLENCTSQGLTCKPVSGGCNEEDMSQSNR
jgi:hypothetical protein